MPVSPIASRSGQACRRDVARGFILHGLINVTHRAGAGAGARPPERVAAYA